MTALSRTELSRLTVKELREKAEILGLKSYKSLKKADLIEAIVKGSTATATPTAPETKKANPVKTNAAAPVTTKSTETNSPKSAKTSTQTVAPSETTKISEKTKNVAKTSTVTKNSEETAKIDAKLEAGEPIEKENLKEESLGECIEENEKDANEKKTEKFVEPDSVFIDHGALIPEFCPGTRLRVLIRDPETIFVYWDSEFVNEEGWVLTAYDRLGNILDQFRSYERRSGRGYFHASAAHVARVSLAEVRGGLVQLPKLQSNVRITEQITTDNRERWMNFESRAIVSESPAPGYAPQVPEQDAFQHFTAPNPSGSEAPALSDSESRALDLDALRRGDIISITRKRIVSHSSWFGVEEEREYLSFSSDTLCKRKY